MCDLSVQVYFEVTGKSLSLSVSLSLMLTLYEVIYDLCLRVNKLHAAKLPSGYIRMWWRRTCGFTDTNNLSSACKHPHANCFFIFIYWGSSAVISLLVQKLNPHDHSCVTSRSPSVEVFHAPVAQTQHRAVSRWRAATVFYTSPVCLWGAIIHQDLTCSDIKNTG